MEIYIVQPEDTIDSIAYKHGITAYKLISDNGLDYSHNLVPGQALIIIYPMITHTVQKGETLGGIAKLHNVKLMQVLRNNPFLNNREYIYPGELLAIQYKHKDKISTNGYTYAFNKRDVLIKTLPYLTYLSIFNYGTTNKGEIITYDDDTEVIKLAKEYGTAPMMMLSALTQKGQVNYGLLYDILLNEEYNTRLMENVLKILKEKGFYGLNMLISDMNISNQKLYLALLEKEEKILSREGFYFTITLNPKLTFTDDQISFEDLNYGAISDYVHCITLLQYTWGTNPGPPAPISSEYLLRSFINHVKTAIPADKTVIGKPLIAYDWELPYVPGRTQALSLTIDRAIGLAKEVGAVIQFDEISQTPYFRYSASYVGMPIEHIVWFIDIRSIISLSQIIDDFELCGSGIWNIMIHYQQMWTFLNYQYEIDKIILDQF